jgi:hypothetical protein
MSLLSIRQHFPNFRQEFPEKYFGRKRKHMSLFEFENHLTDTIRRCLLGGEVNEIYGATVNPSEDLFLNAHRMMNSALRTSENEKLEFPVKMFMNFSSPLF